MPWQRSGTPPSIGNARKSTKSTAKLRPSQRAALSNYAVRSLLLAAQEGAGSAVLLARVSQGGDKLGTVFKPASRPNARLGPAPALPTHLQTAIEMPWRLILAPHAGEQWRHAHEPVTSALTQRTELWHSRLVGPSTNGAAIEPPQADAKRTIRAVWALTGEGSDKTKPMVGTFPATADLPSPGNKKPFRATLEDSDRIQIAHLSSNFSQKGYAPQPLDTNLLMLSSLGGWLDARGAWEPPGLSVEEWVHRASMGRDHYVRVVYKGFLFPFGHRVALVKVSERKFHNGRAGTTARSDNAAYLRQRMFIVVREHEHQYVDPQLVGLDNASFQRQFPFNNIRIITSVTPDLDPPESYESKIDGQPQGMFWPCVGNQPFKFRCVGTDIDGRRVQFDLPMIFMDNTMASPRHRPKLQPKGALVPDYPAAEANAKAAADEWEKNASRADRRMAQLKRQRIALAPTMKAGDTAAEIDEIEFGAAIEAKNNGLRTYSQGLSRPAFYPRVISSRVRIAALAKLAGAHSSNKLTWNAHYLQHGFDAGNKGQVFADVVAEASMAQLDFSTQGDRSGGFVMPNMKPTALSRLTGPVAGDVSTFLKGKLDPTGVFPSSLGDLPLPLLFGCIPLGEVIEQVADLTGNPQKIPKFASEASTKVESFFANLSRAYEFIRDTGSLGGTLANGALAVLQGIVADLKQQAAVLVKQDVATVLGELDTLATRIADLASKLSALLPAGTDSTPPGIDTPIDLGDWVNAVNNLMTQAAEVAKEVDKVHLPSGFTQAVLGFASRTKKTCADLLALPDVITKAKALYQALDAVMGHPEALDDLLSQPDQLAAKIGDVQGAIDPLKTALAAFAQLDGAPTHRLLEVLASVAEALKGAGDLLDLIKMLTGEELVIRFDWNPQIKAWGFTSGKPIFRPNDAHGFVIAVEARVKKSGGDSPKISVLCSLKHFDLILINPAAFIELNFEKIEFKVDAAAKMNVDVLLSDIKFVGPLSFVEALKSLIPLDGFSDPPHLDITEKGIDAGFSLALPNLAVGMFSLSNLSLGAGFTVPFIGQPMSVRFNFCTREQPFNLTVTLFGGGGFFGITLDPHGVQILEAAFEFGANIEIDFGVASGGVHVMAGIYFRMEKTAASLTGYFRLGGHVSVLCIITASLELYLELRYEFDTGKCAGKAELTIEVSVFLFSASVTITCERKFAGSNGDPSFRQIMGHMPELTLADELNRIDLNTDYAWREYCDAFA